MPYFLDFHTRHEISHCDTVFKCMSTLSIFFAYGLLNLNMQIINVYNQDYESGAAFWPDVHSRIIVALITSQVLLMGLLSTRGSAEAVPVIIVLPILTIWFHRFCKGRYEPAFRKNPLQVISNSQIHKIHKIINHCFT